MKESEFVELLHSSLGTDEAKGMQFSQDEWNHFYELARKHSILGVMFRNIDSLPAGNGPSLAIYAKWALILETIRKANARFDKRSADLTKLLSESGFRSCILKGQGTALYYPDPTVRQCGDIDVWVEGSRRQILAFLKEKGYKVSGVVYHHCEAHIFDDVKVEVHFRPSFMNSPLLNARLQKFFKSSRDAQFSNYLPEHGFYVPETDFATIYSTVHIFRHLFHEGIGLRQIIDLYYMLQALPSEKKEYVMSVLDSLNLSGFTAALMWVLSRVLGLDEKYLLCPSCEKKGTMLYEEILKAGNFGFHDPKFSSYQSSSVLVRAWSKITRLAGLVGFCPREVFWAPAFKLGQYLWIKANKY